MPELEDEILQRSREIKTDGYSMSIGETLSMYRDDELDVHPEFQRIFRWTDSQKSRLIESILLGIPIPTIFVAQRDDGVWDVIDGVQRLSTILQFVGIYKGADGNVVSPLTLRGTEYLPSLEGYQFEVDSGNGRVFSETLRRDFKRSKLDVRIVKKESDAAAKYDLFQRLNSGTQLSAQEARNCILVMLDPDFYRWMDELSGESKFLATVLLSSQKEDEGYRQELVLRFFLHYTFEAGEGELRKELGEFITDWVRTAVHRTPEVRADWREVFARTFTLLESSLGDDAFKRFDETKGRFLGPFSISAYEAITAGLVANLDAWESTEPGELRSKIIEMWQTDDYQNNSGAGVGPRRRTPKLIHFGRAFFAR